MPPPRRDTLAAFSETVLPYPKSIAYRCRDMTHLTDMEELLSTVSRDDSRDYMLEAMTCYHAGAYRGTVVLSIGALFHDILHQLNELAAVDSDARSIRDEVTSRQAAQEPYETYLLDQLTSTKLIDTLDSEFIRLLQRLRNKSAHPSGHSPSAEEARFVFSETIRRVGAKPVLRTTVLVDELVRRLGNENLFPLQSMESIASVVDCEISALHPDGLPYLVAKLIDALRSSHDVTKTNAEYFVIGLAKSDMPRTADLLRQKLVVGHSDDAAFSDTILRTLSSNGRIALDFDAITTGRVGALIKNKIDNTPHSSHEHSLAHPANVLAAILAASDGSITCPYEDQVIHLLTHRPLSPRVYLLVSKYPRFAPSYFDALLAATSSGNFNVTKSAVHFLKQHDAGLAELLNDQQALLLVAAVLGSARMGTYAAKDVVTARFSDLPHIRERAISFLRSDSIAATHILAAWDSAFGSVEDFITARLQDYIPSLDETRTDHEKPSRPEHLPS